MISAFCGLSVPPYFLLPNLTLYLPPRCLDLQNRQVRAMQTGSESIGFGGKQLK